MIYFALFLSLLDMLQTVGRPSVTDPAGHLRWYLF